MMIFDDQTKEKEILKMCRFCFMCRHACPVFLATKKDANTPRGHALLITMVNEGISDWTDELINRIYECSQCHLCKELCEFHWEEDILIQKIREKIVEYEKTPERITNIALKIINNVPIHGKIESSDKKIVKDNCGLDVLYYAGPNTSSDESILKKTYWILDQANIRWGVLEEELQTGVELFDLGFTKEAKEAADQVTKILIELKPEKIITGDPHVYRALKKLYPEWGIPDLKDIEIYHISEYLYTIIKNGRLKFKKGNGVQKIAYHDPCNLGREMDIYDKPREVIKAISGIYPIELFHSRNEAECCGSGSIMYLTDPDISEKIAHLRIKRALEEEAEVIVTGCPNCKRIFKKVINDNDYDLEIMDILELIFLQMNSKGDKIST